MLSRSRLWSKKQLEPLAGSTANRTIQRCSGARPAMVETRSASAPLPLPPYLPPHPPPYTPPHPLPTPPLPTPPPSPTPSAPPAPSPSHALCTAIHSLQTEAAATTGSGGTPAKPQPRRSHWGGRGAMSKKKQDTARTGESGG